MDSPSILAKCSQIRNLYGPTTGPNTSTQDNLWSIATSTNLKTGSEPVNASTPGSAEAPECAKAKAGAMEMTLARKSTNEHEASETRLRPYLWE